MKRIAPIVFLAVMLTAVILLSLRPIGAYDSLYTAKIGQIILQKHRLPQTETISWSAQGREWIIHQPFAEVALGALDLMGGPELLSYSAPAMLVAFTFLLYLFLTKLCRVPASLAVVLSFFSAATLDEFFIPRAQIFGQLFFLMLLYIVYLRITTKRNLLPLTAPLMYLWANSHASFVLLPYVLMATGALCFVRARRTAWHLFFWGVISLAVSILPPIGIQGWRVLLSFTSDMQFLRNFITEWSPLYLDFPHFTFYVFLVCVFGALSIVGIRKSKNTTTLLFAPMLLPIIVIAFISLRHVPFGITAMFVLFGVTLTPPAKTPHRLPIWILTLAAILCIPLSVWLFHNKFEAARDSAWHFPWKAAQFMKDHKLSGRMFNEMALGSFLLYKLYPQYQVFFDGRVEVFGCCEMRDFYTLMRYKNSSYDDFALVWEEFDTKYQFSYAVLPIVSYNPLERTTVDRIADLMLDDRRWILVYFDDTVRIFVKKDGRNDEIIRTFSLDPLTPLQLTPYPEEQSTAAQNALNNIPDAYASGLSEYMKGVLTQDAGNRQKAHDLFEKSAALNPYYGLPLLSLATIAREDGDMHIAQTYAQAAIKRSPYLGEGYILLATIAQSQGNTKDAMRILERGLGNNLTFLDRQKIVQMLSALSTTP